MGAGEGRIGRREREFTYFRLGDGKDANGTATSSTPTLTPAAAAAERASIAAKLAALHLARRKAKQDRHNSQTRRPSSSSGQPNGTNPTDPTSSENRHVEPVIQWKHLEKSLRETRASISREERVRLERIYAEFVQGRDGRMQDGQGGSEVGGRSSLM